MGLNFPELALLSLLLNHKMPNSRIANLMISNTSFPIESLPGCRVKSIEEVKEILSSLEKKNIIKLEEFCEPLKQHEVVGSGSEEKDKELERLNACYILKEIDADGYEKKFYELFSKAERGSEEDVMPLTLLEKYISILKQLFNILTIMQSLQNKRLENLKSLIEKSALQISKEIIDMFHKHLEAVKEIIGKKQNGEISVLVHLYPFFNNLIEEKVTTLDERNRKEIAAEIERIKASINVEKEIINILMMLREDEKKISAHQYKLQSLENRLKDLESQIRGRNLVIRFSSNVVDIGWIKNKLISLFGEIPSICSSMVEGFVENLASILHNTLYKETHYSKGMPYYELDLSKMVMEEKEVKEDHYIIKASLIWINESCPIMLDSIIESDGKELTICKNPECFVVYHKKCLEGLLQTGVNKCLVCGYPIT